MGRHFLTELAYLVAGLVVVAVVTQVAAWSYPLGRAAIGWTGWVAAVVVFAMAWHRLREGWERDRSGD